MPSWFEGLLIVLWVAAGAGFVVVGIHIDRRYSTTGARSLTAFAITMGLLKLTGGASGIGLLLIEGSLTAELSAAVLPLPLEIAFIGMNFIGSLSLFLAPFFWGLFVLQYTTRLERTEKLGVRLVFSYLVFGGLLFVGRHVARDHFGWTPASVVETAVSLLWWLVYTGVILILVGVFVGGALQLYRASRRFRPLRSRTVAALIGALWVPQLVAFILVQYLVSGEVALIVGTSGDIIGLGLLWLTVSRYGIFEQLPAARAVGRNTAIDALNTAIVILDAEGYVTDLNVAAERLFETTADAAIGSSFETLLPPMVQTATITEQQRTTVRFPDRDLVVEAETATSTDSRGRELGQTIVFYDVTEKRRRRQRIQVLNRVLRHNLRNELAPVENYSSLIADGGVDTSEYADKISTQVAELINLGETARQIEEVLGAERIGASPTTLLSLVEDVLGDTARPNASVTVDVPETVAVRANPTILNPVFVEVLENAIQHTDKKQPEIAVTYRESERAVVIADNGPGIPDYELSVFETGEETPLDHGSGLGLWLVKWGVDSLGGHVSFDTDSDGTEVLIQLPDDLIVERPAQQPS